ncbi:MAG: hypothetical protein UU81_C0042G0006 [Microgenomates group bacterium GW2011_GWC1_41_8]|uniref:Uncharacterized protein n=3 Tax=Candidatus Roizmaniibacteriota TaxID=1752723 RepID=A0A0G1ACW4_9BACT|nr:MAG: hypothetical protein UU14_C0005G0003 [Candidatus Roizmanbacteria bacterium GW2011_GWB1_40_7]KKR92351.1 MAG: hypothetical protein UU41_C0027G0012 [Candidatus Roizmanbacteria bacterium GW2011_GWA1_41_13]KKS23037.1 MAG: hypothetical protein UU81_C0042G0006 [Microgenomates group bacterium GW2011_GWC1_41_8]KKS23098.1 MAG: hypothetical protein UU78_C0004G0013 [Candidatus Roizmanbacteria bacterium GW2011_GWC2_41_7]
MIETVQSESTKRSTFALPILVVVQFFLTIGTLGLVAYFKLFAPTQEYPVMIVDPTIDGQYAEKFKGKVTIFDLDDIVEWHYYNDPEATTSAQTGLSFIYPPNFDVSEDADGTIRISQNKKDFIVVSKNWNSSIVPDSPKLVSLGAEKEFNKFQELKIETDNKNIETSTTPIIYQGSIGNYKMTILDMQSFSPEVVYLIMMSMDYHR